MAYLIVLPADHHNYCECMHKMCGLTMLTYFRISFSPTPWAYCRLPLTFLSQCPHPPRICDIWHGTLADVFQMIVRTNAGENVWPFSPYVVKYFVIKPYLYKKWNFLWILKDVKIFLLIVKRLLSFRTILIFQVRLRFNQKGYTFFEKQFQQLTQT